MLPYQAPYLIGDTPGIAEIALLLMPGNKLMAYPWAMLNLDL